MKHEDASYLSMFIKGRLHDLRSRFGPLPCLTVVSGVAAEAYRLAGMTGIEFAELLQAQTTERGRLLIHLRRKPIMRLRAGYDGESGGLTDEGGLVGLNLHFEGGHYMETGRPTVQIVGKMPSSLAVVGTLNRPVSDIVRNLPRCLRPRSIRTSRISVDTNSWCSFMRFHVRPHFETLELMPAWMSRELGVEQQIALDQMPWLPGGSPVREPAREMARSATPAVPPRGGSGLRIVVSN